MRLAVWLAWTTLAACATLPKQQQQSLLWKTDTQESVQSEVESNMRATEATLQQVQKDVAKLDTFGEEVARSLAQEHTTKQARDRRAADRRGSRGE